jgi:hypothetical protein
MGNWRIHLQWYVRWGNCSIDIKLVRSAGFIYSPIHIHTHHTFRIVDDVFLDGRVYPCVWRFYSHKFKRFFHPHLSSYQVNLNSDQDSQVLLLIFLDLVWFSPLSPTAYYFFCIFCPISFMIFSRKIPHVAGSNGLWDEFFSLKWLPVGTQEGGPWHSWLRNVRNLPAIYAIPIFLKITIKWWVQTVHVRSCQVGFTTLRCQILHFQTCFMSPYRNHEAIMG